MDYFEEQFGLAGLLVIAFFCQERCDRHILNRDLSVDNFSVSGHFGQSRQHITLYLYLFTTCLLLLRLSA